MKQQIRGWNDSGDNGLGEYKSRGEGAVGGCGCGLRVAADVDGLKTSMELQGRGKVTMMLSCCV